MKRILVLSATTGYQLRSFGDAAARLGCELVYATDRCRTLDDPWEDDAVPVRFHDRDGSVRAIVHAAATRPVHGVLAVGDRPTVLAADAAEALGLPGNPPEAAAVSANKRAARSRFRAAGLNTPWFTTVHGPGTPHPEFEPRFPCVLKPLGLSGSRGVIRANNQAEADAALWRIRALLARRDIRAMRTGIEDEILVEGYIDGREYAVEGVLTHGALQVLAIFDKPDPLQGPFFEETIYLAPSSLPPRDQSRIATEIAKGCAALGLRHGPVHAECRLGPDGIYILEIAPRPIGGLCSKVLRFGGGTVSLEELLLRHATGEDVSFYRRERQAAGVMMIPIPKRGLLKGVEGEDRAREVAGIEDVTITAKPDQLLEPLPEAGSYLGFIFARAESPAAVDAALRDAHGRLRFIVDTPIAVL